MAVGRGEPEAPEGFAVPVVVGLTLWLVVTRLLPVVGVETGLDVSCGVMALWSFVQPPALLAALVLGLVGAFRLIRALELHLGAGRPGPGARAGGDRSAGR